MPSSRRVGPALVVLSFLGGTAAGCARTPVDPSGEAGRAASGGEEASDRCHPKVGSRAPDASFVSLNGHGRVGIERGTVTLVYFWATWEAPSKHAFPRFEELYRKHRARGFRILALSVDDDSAGVVEAGTSWGATFPLGREQALTECFAPSAEPAGFLVDKSGIVRAFHPGYHDGEHLEIEKQVEVLLDEAVR